MKVHNTRNFHSFLAAFDLEEKYRGKRQHQASAFISYCKSHTLHSPIMFNSNPFLCGHFVTKKQQFWIVQLNKSMANPITRSKSKSRIQMRNGGRDISSLDHHIVIV
jgi:hypothetical protein